MQLSSMSTHAEPLYIQRQSSFVQALLLTQSNVMCSPGVPGNPGSGQRQAAVPPQRASHNSHAEPSQNISQSPVQYGGIVVGPWVVVEEGVAVVEVGGEVVDDGTDVVVVEHGSGGNSPDKHPSVEEALAQPMPSTPILDGSQWHSGSIPVQFWWTT